MALITQSDSASLISPSRGVFAAATLAELKTFTVPLVNQTVEVDGSVTRGDGLAGTYYWNATDSRADNGTTIIQSNAGGVGRWNLVAATALDSTFTPAGAGAVTRPVQDALRAAIRGSDYSTAANFIAAVTSLTEAFGAATLNIGPQTGWSTIEKLSFVDTAKSFFGARNLPLLGATQTNYFQFLGHDDNNTVPNIVTTYAAMTDNHAAGTRASSVGFESDMLHTGAGTTTGESAVIGFARVDAGIVGATYGVQGQVSITAGAVTNAAGVTGLAVQSGGAVTNSYAAWFQGPNKTGGTVANNYGVYIGRVGSGGTVSNYQLYVEGSGAGNPVVIDNAGNLGVGMAVPVNTLDVTGTFGATGVSTFGAKLRMTAASSQIHPGTANFRITNNADSFNNLLLDDAGNLTIRTAFACNGGTAQTASTGYGTPTNGAKQASFDATAITLPNLAKAVAQLIIDLKAFGFLAA